MKIEARASRRVLALLLSLLVVSVYGGHEVWADDEKTSVSEVEPCELLSKVEAEEVMETVLTEGKYSENRVVGQKLCLYEALDTDSFDFLQIGLTQDASMAPDTLASGQNARAIFASIKEAFPDRQNVIGIGDDAFFATPGIHVLKGGYYVTIGAGNIGRNKGRLVNAAKKAIANLDGR